MQRFAVFDILVIGILFQIFTGAVASEGPVVRVKDGFVRGSIVEADGGRKVNFFQGIRFGRAERFHQPNPVEPWTGIYDATKPQFSCPQLTVDKTMKISEDCLFLNVWQPAIHKPYRPVMVWIYGGGFQQGTIFTDLFDSRHIAGLGDVVVVAINYRLGPLGFASFGTPETPGNLGLHDQILGLQWVQENIAQFGGNPQNVTLFGESAGSMSVGALVLSPLTTNLFQRAIMQSGGPNTQFAVEPRARSLRKSLSFANRLGCKVDDLQSAMACLQNKTAKQLVESSMEDLTTLESFFPIFGDGDNGVLPIDPKLALEKFDRSIDLLFGVTRDEGTMFIGMVFPDIDIENITLNSAKKGIEAILAKTNIATKEWNLILNHYTKDLSDKSSPQELRIALSNVYGDYLLVCPTVLFGEQVARNRLIVHQNKVNSTNNHFYAYRLMMPLKFINSPWKEWMGVGHAQDVFYLFGLPLIFYGKLPDITKEQVQLSRDMIGAWSQFAKTGQMSPVSGVQWTEALDRIHPERSSVSYFSLDSTNYKMVNNYWNDTCDKLWKPIIDQQ